MPSLDRQRLSDYNVGVKGQVLSCCDLVFVVVVSEFVTVSLSLRFANVSVAETEFTFYDCSLVQQLSGRRP